jgi:tellurite resistance protein TerC
VHDFPLWGWGAFGALLFAMLAVDIFVHRGEEREDSRRTATFWIVIWVSVGLAFAGFIWRKWGGQHAGDYIAAYLIEVSLSIDNLFVFLIIFRSLNIPKSYQRKALTWGIFGAMVLRGAFIFAGTAALQRWHWISYAFGAVLVWASIKILREGPEQEENKIVVWMSRYLPLTTRLDHPDFFTVENGRRVATPLFLALLGLDVTDVLFAFDSVPAAFSVTTHTFIVFSSNTFAILGLRSMYIVLAQSLSGLRYLKYGLGAVLSFAGLKLVTATWINVPSWASIAFILATIGTAVFFSLRYRKREEAEQAVMAEAHPRELGKKESSRT